MYSLLDKFFVVFHTSLILFNLFGWIWKKTRLANLITLGITGSSWLILGLIVGMIGYCPLTDWHFNILFKLGKKNLPISYIKYLADRLTGLDFNQTLIDNATLYGFIIALVISLLLNIKDFRKSKDGKSIVKRFFSTGQDWIADDIIAHIEIIDPDQFWKISRYAVVELKK
ncbi:MAG: DUF2784 domain-containing protein [Bacteroidales bacterium]|nr:DUF2784 domain-containing protein [Bacteroidales bacterium]MDT8373986.1 DUF2784 domain-containing protein [Bacteroidales bacterium]